MANYKRQMGIEEDKDSPAYGRVTEARRMDAPSKYDSIRPSGEEGRLNDQKVRGLKQAAMGVALSPLVVPAETVFGGRSSGNKGPIGAGVEQLAGTGDRLAKSLKETKNFIGSGVNQYKKAKDEEADLDRELNSQTKRETRGMKTGGSTSSFRSSANGIAQRGKTRGTMVMCGGGMARGRK
jgi:hypothetical protein